MTTGSLLFVHSTGTGPLLWASVPSDVIGGREALFPPLLGYPPNAPVPRGVGVTAADDARELLRVVPDGARHVHLVGHSYGGLVALLAAETLGERVASLFLAEPVLFGSLANDAHPDADAAAVRQARELLEHPWFLRDETEGGGEAWLAHFVDYWNRPGSWSKMPEPVRETTRAVGWKMFQEVRACFADERAFGAYRIDVPCTVLTFGRSPAAARAMAKALARDHAPVTLVDLPDLGHMAPLTSPAAVHAALADHLAHARRPGARSHG